MESSLDALPQEILREEILPWCREYAPALRAVCCEWRAAAALLPLRASRGKGLSFLARRGHTDLLCWARALRFGGEWEVSQRERILRAAARGGHEALCIRAARVWGADNYDVMLAKAALGGHAALCCLAKEWGAVQFSDMVWGAARGGHEALCRLAMAWLPVDSEMGAGFMLHGAARGGNILLCERARDLGSRYVGALYEAARGGHADVCRVLWDWGVHDYDDMLEGGAYGGHENICRQALEWGGDRFDSDQFEHAFHSAVRGGHATLLPMLLARFLAAMRGTHIKDIREDFSKEDLRQDSEVSNLLEVAMTAACEANRLDVVTLLHTWGARVSYDEELSLAASNNNVDLMGLLKAWGATDFDGAFTFAAREGHIQAMRLLRAWGATNLEEGFIATAAWGEAHTMTVLKGWGATSYDRALAAAATSDSIKTMYLLKAWGATDFDRALVADASVSIRREAPELLVRWGARAFGMMRREINVNLKFSKHSIDCHRRVDKLEKLALELATVPAVADDDPYWAEIGL